MRYKFVKSAACALVMVFTLSFAVVNTQAQKNDFNEARDDVKDATRVLNTFVQKPDNFIPRELLERAEGIAVFPGVIKAASSSVGVVVTASWRAAPRTVGAFRYFTTSAGRAGELRSVSKAPIT